MDGAFFFLLVWLRLILDFVRFDPDILIFADQVYGSISHALKHVSLEVLRRPLHS